MPADRHVLGVAISSKPSSAVRARAQLDGLLLGKIRVGWRRAAKLPFFARTFDGPLLYAALVADLVAGRDDVANVVPVELLMLRRRRPVSALGTLLVVGTGRRSTKRRALVRAAPVAVRGSTAVRQCCGGRLEAGREQLRVRRWRRSTLGRARETVPRDDLEMLSM